ncbi:STAS/SEC14 domain-containing protein [Laribacter hongkongensis]|uniref:STAS/SEC14 domain-containing protein n=2 Tax=Laribacter hongkongensis TaxID=168471 RepID=C1DA99_LARHH|nr:STAS/SEC14 domain-containing protein [Laribacter hongkongensis]ACO75214.1 hypothetical protein LHK_02230 [Laribacter hongkongensis HLHK9]ASJ25130.1 SpoIIAA-like [Laribacter hongkongensis]MBE5530208.1 hypothetical protein [Laribacter hongkongensis]MCG8992089.1 STAS/SEC14 domain-containing protein [Laribacter hongkongensis]MCG8994071.1 STAS/SEC14 domain-containing protein [Laribacter hongkongensis]
MISIREQEYGLDVAIYNEFTLADFKDFEVALLDYKMRKGQPNVLLDLSEVMDFTIDMAIEELRFVRAHQHDFGRVAVVVKDGWMKLATHIADLLANTETAHFEDGDAARAWLHDMI